MDLFFGTIGHFALWLTAHRDISYIVLFFGAYFETLIGTCFFIPGEVFFISGALLAGAHVLWLPAVLLVLFGGATLGDSSSYYIGYRVGSSVFKEGRVVLSPANYLKGEKLFATYGPRAVFIARLLGPLSWVMPFLAGIYKVPYRTFLPYNVAGVLVGVSQFIIVGYFFGRHVAIFPLLLHRYLFLVLFIVGLAVLLFTHNRVTKRVKKEQLPNES